MGYITNTVVCFDWKTVIYIYGIFKLFLLRKGKRDRLLVNDKMSLDLLRFCCRLLFTWLNKRSFFLNLFITECGSFYFSIHERKLFSVFRMSKEPSQLHNMVKQRYSARRGYNYWLVNDKMSLDLLRCCCRLLFSWLNKRSMRSTGKYCE
jgi:hypothetical protein